MVMDCSGFGNCLAIRLHRVKIAKKWKLDGQGETRTLPPDSSIFCHYQRQKMNIIAVFYNIFFYLLVSTFFWMKDIPRRMTRKINLFFGILLIVTAAFNQAAGISFRRPLASIRKDKALYDNPILRFATFSFIFTL